MGWYGSAGEGVRLSVVRSCKFLIEHCAGGGVVAAPAIGTGSYRDAAAVNAVYYRLHETCVCKLVFVTFL